MTHLSRLVVLGATGDLAGRLLLPAIAEMRAAGELAPGFRVVGVGDQPWDDAEFAAHVRARLERHAGGVPVAAREVLLGAVSYREADVRDASAVRAAVAVASLDGDEPIVAYLALPTQLMAPAVRSLSLADLPVGSRIAVEKPFGSDLASARELNALLARAAPGEGSVYRVDHTLGLPALAGLPHLTGAGLSRLEVLFEETLALEGRAAFYDQAGALRDVMQNHMMQMLCAVAAQPGEQRVEVLRRIRPLGAGEVQASRRARYLAGTLATGGGADGRAVPDYAAEAGVDPRRQTETFAEVTLAIDSRQWDGVPIVLRAGKALAARRRGVLVVRADGSEVLHDLDAGAGAGNAAEVGAYVAVLRDLLAGSSALSVGAEEAELAWAIVAPVLQAWGADQVPLGAYVAGGSGPT